MTQRTVTAFFTDRSEATRTVERLVDAGIPRSAIRLLPETGAMADTSIGGMRTDSYYTGSSRSTYGEGMAERGLEGLCRTRQRPFPGPRR